MARLVSFLVLFGSLVYVSGLPSTNANVTTSSEAQTRPIATILSERLVDVFSTKLTSLARSFQLNIRVVRFLASLYTNQNLMLLRDLLRRGVRFANFILRVTPQTINDPGFEWVMVITELFRKSNATEELLGMFLLSQPVSSYETPAEISSEHREDQTDQPNVFEAAIVSENSDSYELHSMTKSTRVQQEKSEVNEGDFESAIRRIMA